MSSPLAILKQYWGYSSFRPLQEDIINAQLKGSDVLALLPTGGGKSVCFQVPVLLSEGICIVVTPLIALMQDQVYQLRQRGIKADAIYSGMSYKAIDIKLDNCVYGDVKFLYVSPERLQTDIFKERLLKMNVSSIAVDEAHCISQWGYDFRPSYLRIADLREVLPDVRIVALTASATAEVREDIQNKLKFKEGKVFTKSFARSNLAYVVRKVEDKQLQLLSILKAVTGSAIIYAGTRKMTKEVAVFLYKNGISANFYHAGLNQEERTERQKTWINNQTRVMVATNAFGMGIDKPDVRLVVHMSLPPDLESYYQEAGRAGRDEKKAYATILYYDQDLEELQNRLKLQNPSVDLMKKVYQCIANYYQLAAGSGQGQSFDFNMAQFAGKYGLNQLEAYNAIKKLEEEELLQMNEGFYRPSTLKLAVDNNELYKFQIANSNYDSLIKALLRIYGGELFNHFLAISESQVASLLNARIDDIYAALNKLNDASIVIYEGKKDSPQLTFVQPRFRVEKLTLNTIRINTRREAKEAKAQKMIEYVKNTEACRTLMLLNYFNEMNADSCGVCDVCLKNKKSISSTDRESYKKQLIHVLKEEALVIDEIVEKVNPSEPDLLMDIVRQMLDSGELEYDESWRVYLVSG